MHENLNNGQICAWQQHKKVKRQARLDAGLSSAVEQAYLEAQMWQVLF